MLFCCLEAAQLLNLNKARQRCRDLKDAALSQSRVAPTARCLHADLSPDSTFLQMFSTFQLFVLVKFMCTRFTKFN